MKQNGKGSMIAALLFTFIFVISMLVVLILGARIYHDIQKRTEESVQRRIGISYLAAKIHANDRAQGVSIAQFGDQDALLLHQTFSGQPYVTAIYVFDGYLRELFCSDLSAFEPKDGTPVVRAQALDVQKNGNLLYLRYFEENGQEQASYITLRSSI